ncbi:hypothetical protein Hdeb2414_s0019g00542871 [Helianthus debilis subsp. tardiflorus]
MAITGEVADVTRLGIEIINSDGCFFLFENFQVVIVVGGGNKFHGSSWAGNNGLDRSSADYIG